MEKFRDIAWPELDVLLVDLPPGTGDIVLSILEQIPVTGCVLVTTPQKLAVADATRGVAMFHDLDIPVFGLVENMNEFICPCCGEAQTLFPSGAARQLAERKHIPYLGGIPLEPEAQRMADNGTPMMISQPQAKASMAFAEVANSVSQALIREQAFRERDADPEARAAHQDFWENLLDD